MQNYAHTESFGNVPLDQALSRLSVIVDNSLFRVVNGELTSGYSGIIMPEISVSGEERGRGASSGWHRKHRAYLRLCVDNKLLPYSQLDFSTSEGELKGYSSKTTPVHFFKKEENGLNRLLQTAALNPDAKIAARKVSFGRYPHLDIVKRLANQGRYQATGFHVKFIEVLGNKDVCLEYRQTSQQDPSGNLLLHGYATDRLAGIKRFLEN